MNKNVLYEHLLEYCSKVKTFEQHFMEVYGVQYKDFYSCIDRVYPRVGECKVHDNTCEYNFHGKGCRFRCEKFTVDYDLAPYDRDTIKFSGAYIRQYIESVTRITYSREDIERWLKELCTEGKIEKPSVLEQYDMSRTIV